MFTLSGKGSKQGQMQDLEQEIEMLTIAPTPPGTGPTGRIPERLCAVLLHALFPDVAQYPHRLGRRPEAPQ